MAVTPEETTMLQIIDPVRFDAFVRLLAQPDPPDLPHRGHVHRCDGDPNRRATRLPRILMGWLQERHLRVDDEDPLPVATRSTLRRANHSLRVLRPTGTDDR
jgi:hypothetical protein